MKSAASLQCALLLSALACTLGTSPVPTPPIPANTPAASATHRSAPAGRCGDGVCAGPENASICPADCQAAGLATQPAATGRPADPPPTADVAQPDSGAIPPLYFFYAIHTHAGGDYQPYDGPPMAQIDTRAADNMLLAIAGIQEVLDRYGVKGTWEVVYGTASGLCAYQGDEHIFRRLQAAGHEIAVHAHRTEDIEPAFQALRDDCGITAETTSGFILDAERAGPSGAQAAMSSAIATSVGLGMSVGTENLSPGGGMNPFAELCGDQLGVGNDMWPQTGNLMHPWRPDYANGNICADNPAGELVLVDHVSIEWMIVPGQPKPSVLGALHFDQLRGLFDAALQYVADNRPARAAAWGFVTHITEFGPGGDATRPPDPASLAALGDFLAYVDSHRAAGRVVYATAREIADMSISAR